MLTIITSSVLISFLFWNYRAHFNSLYSYYSLRQLSLLKREWEIGVSQCILSNHLQGKPLGLPQYKFYTNLVFELLEQAQKWGLEYQGILVEIRKRALYDFDFSNKMLQIFWQGQAQFFVISIITWGLYFSIIFISGISLGGKTALIILCLQVSGAVIYLCIFHQMSKRFSSLFEQYFSSLYKFKGLMRLNLPLASIVEKSEIKELRAQGSFDLENINALIKDIVESIILSGGEGVGERLDLLCVELSYLQEKYLEMLRRKVVVYKMGITLFFYLPAYILNIWGILGRMTL